MEVEEWVFTGFSRQSEQVCSESRPCRLAGEFRNDQVGLAVERVNDLGSDKLLGCHLEPVGVALDCIMQPRGWVTESAEERRGWGGGVVGGQGFFEQFGRGAGGGGVGGGGSPSPTP